MKQLIRAALGAVGYRVEGMRYSPRQLLDRSSLRVLSFDDVLRLRMFECGPELTLVQIREFDRTGDPSANTFASAAGGSSCRASDQGQRIASANSMLAMIEVLL
jgi:hypothetical protein